MKVTFSRLICARVLYKTVLLLSAHTTSLQHFVRMLSQLTEKQKKRVHFINRWPPYGDGQLIMLDEKILRDKRK